MRMSERSAWRSTLKEASLALGIVVAFVTFLAFVVALPHLVNGAKLTAPTCAPAKQSAVGDRPVPYKVMSEPNRETVTLRVILADAEQVQSLCGTFARGCYLRSDIEGLGLIVSEKPRDFNDEYRLMILGHEMFHALGATHD